MWNVIPTLVTVATLVFGGPAAAPQPVDPPVAAQPVAAVSVVPDAERTQAREILSKLQSQYRGLDDVSVEFGRTPEGHEAVAYYATGRIVISDRHTVDIEKILAHEIWHIIDYRDNGRLDWGEDLPPARASDYLTK